MYCPNCKKDFPEGHAFCDTCGGKLVDAQQGAAPQAPVQNTPYQNTNQPAPAQAYTPQPAYNTRPTYSAPAYAGAPAPQKNETVSFGMWFVISLIGIVPFFFGLVSVLAVVAGTVLGLLSGASVGLNPIGLIFTVLTILYFLLLIIWSFGGARKRTLRSYARATLVVSVILIVLAIVGYFALQDYIMGLGIDFSNLADTFNMY